MERRVITIARQLASGGDSIAADLAKGLKVPLIERQIMEAAAAQAGVSPETISEAERVPGLLERMFEYLGRYGGLEDPVPSLDMEAPFYGDMTRDHYRHLVEDFLRRVAETSDAVIVAHGGSVVLRDVPYVFKVLVTAPFDLRVHRLQEYESLPLPEAERRIREDDKSRLDYFRTYYKVHWLNSTLYDLCINTRCLTPQTAVKVIRKAHAELVLNEFPSGVARVLASV